MNNLKKMEVIKVYKVTIDLNLIAYYTTTETYNRFIIFLFFNIKKDILS